MIGLEQKPYNVSFTSGVNYNIVKSFAMNSPKGIENILKNEYGINANFEGNKYVASCCAAVADIFETLSKKYDLPFMAKPPNIRMFNKNTLLDQRNSDSLAFCLTESGPVLKNEPFFELRSLFLSDKYKTLQEIDNVAENNFATRWNSTSHFLHTYIHEWVHNVHDDILYKIFGYDGPCPFARQRYNTYNGYYYDPNPNINGVRYLTGDLFNASYTDAEKAVIREKISGYAAGKYDENGKKIGGNPFEFIAEYVTKKIVEVLDPDTLQPTAHPFAKFNQEDMTIQELFQKAWHGIIN